MRRTDKEMAGYTGGELRGEGCLIIESIASLKNAGPGDLVYAEEKFYGDVAASRAGCVLVKSGDFPGRTIILVKNPKLAFARAAAWLLAEAPGSAGIHPSVTIAPTARVGEGVKIGPNTVIEEGASVGDRTVIEAGSYIGEGSRIGSDCVIYPRVVFYSNVQVGNRVVIHAGAVIGADGFGFVKDGRINVKFPQIGRVVIEDDVEIGANTCIDRGSLETTIIRRGVKLDNLVQIAHNVQIGEDTLIAAQTGVSGGSTVGAECIIAGQVGIADRVRLDDHSIIGAQGGVPSGKHIRGGEVHWGTPARPLKEILAQQAYLARLVKKTKAPKAGKSRSDR